MVLEMPNFQRPMLRHIASGWRLSTIYSYRTGEYVNVTAAGGNDFARNGTNVGNQLAQYAGGDRIDDSGRPLSLWFNNSAYANPALGTIGNAGTRAVPCPSHFDFNMALVRAFKVTERQRFEFRYEVYNLTNSFRPLLAAPGGTPTVSTDITSPTFGQLRISDDPRIMQFALKYFF